MHCFMLNKLILYIFLRFWMALIGNMNDAPKKKGKRVTLCLTQVFNACQSWTLVLFEGLIHILRGNLSACFIIIIFLQNKYL